MSYNSGYSRKKVSLGAPQRSRLATDTATPADLYTVARLLYTAASLSIISNPKYNDINVQLYKLAMER